MCKFMAIQTPGKESEKGENPNDKWKISIINEWSISDLLRQCKKVKDSGV